MSVFKNIPVHTETQNLMETLEIRIWACADYLAPVFHLLCLWLGHSDNDCHHFENLEKWQSKENFRNWEYRGVFSTDNEVELLLKAINEYKVQKVMENVDWESCQSRYLDVWRQHFQKFRFRLPHVNMKNGVSKTSTIESVFKNLYSRSPITPATCGWGASVAHGSSVCCLDIW